MLAATGPGGEGQLAEPNVFTWRRQLAQATTTPVADPAVTTLADPEGTWNSSRTTPPVADDGRSTALLQHCER
jgi:hypothetical protein